MPFVVFNDFFEPFNFQVLCYSLDFEEVVLICKEIYLLLISGCLSVFCIDVILLIHLYNSSQFFYGKTLAMNFKRNERLYIENRSFLMYETRWLIVIGPKIL